MWAKRHICEYHHICESALFPILSNWTFLEITTAILVFLALFHINRNIKRNRAEKSLLIATELYIYGLRLLPNFPVFQNIFQVLSYEIFSNQLSDNPGPVFNWWLDPVYTQYLIAQVLTRPGRKSVSPGQDIIPQYPTSTL